MHKIERWDLSMFHIICIEFHSFGFNDFLVETS